MRYIRICILGVLAGYLCGWAPAMAQTDGKYVQDVIDAGNRTIQLLLDKFRPAFPSDRRNLLDDSRIYVFPAANFNAYSNTATGEIKIPGQLVAEALLQIEGFILVRRNPSLNTRYADWTRYLQARSDSALRAAKGPGAVDQLAIKPFWSYIGRSTPPTLDSDELRLREQFMIDGLGLVLAHELGHLVLNHRRHNEVTTALSHKQEHEADQFAAKLVSNSGLSLLPGLTFYLRFAMSESAMKRAAPNTHPRAECRFYRIGAPELNRTLADPARKDDFERSSNMNVAQLQQLFRRLQKECN